MIGRAGNEAQRSRNIGRGRLECGSASVRPGRYGGDWLARLQTDAAPSRHPCWRGRLGLWTGWRWAVLEVTPGPSELYRESRGRGQPTMQRQVDPGAWTKWAVRGEADGRQRIGQDDFCPCCQTWCARGDNGPMIGQKSAWGPGQGKWGQGDSFPKFLARLCSPILHSWALLGCSLSMQVNKANQAN